MNPHQFHERPAANAKERWQDRARITVALLAAGTCLLIAGIHPTLIPDLLHWIGTR